MNEGATDKRAGRLLWVGLGLCVAAGLFMRLSVYGQSIVGDELSTLWIVDNHGLGGVISFVSGDGEISPPFYFVLAWFASKLGGAPELVRLPSLLAGLASLPLYFLIGKRLFSQNAGIVAASVAALSPFLVYFSANGRSYSVMIFLLLVSLLTMLIAAEDGRKRWWAGYALASCLAMYTHYTAAFVLIAQLGWLLLAMPQARRAALISNAAAAAFFLPWLPSYFADSDSPTIPLLEALQGSGFEAKQTAVEQLLFWKIGSGVWTMGDRWDAVLIVAAVFAATVVVVVRLARGRELTRRLREIDPAVVLVALIILSTPIGALILGLFSTDVFGGRNLAGSWVALPLAAGALMAAAGAAWGLVCTVALLIGVGYASVELTDSSKTEIPFSATADYIESEAEPGDAVVNRSHLTPVPLTPLDAYLDPGIPEYRIGLPTSDPPFLPNTVEVPDPEPMLREALMGSDRIFFVTVGDQTPPEPGVPFEVAGKLLRIPRNWTVASRRMTDGIYPVTVTVLERQ